MIDIPLVVEPPDLVVVEVLEALPGRPISGERLVRPDGKISLGFYGDVDVRGLTTTQLKEEIVLHLRGTLPDQVLGLFAIGEDGQWKKVPPRDVVTVFADVSSYNSKFYYVDGDVAAPGKMPFTGQETVLDALNYAGGLHHTADPKSIRLYRPAPGGKPAKVYPIDLDAIQRGDSRMNYQVFPGDRLVVGRDDMIQATIQQDRQAAAIQTTLNSMLQLSLMTRSLVQATPDLTPAQREDLAREWFALWWKSFQRPGGPAPDEAVFRELLLKMLKNTKDPGKPAEGGKK